MVGLVGVMVATSDVDDPQSGPYRVYFYSHEANLAPPRLTPGGLAC